MTGGSEKITNWSDFTGRGVGRGARVGMVGGVYFGGRDFVSAV